MPISRRGALGSAGLLAAALAPGGPAALASGSGTVAATDRRAEFPFDGTYLNAAYVHPLPRAGFAAAQAFAQARLLNPTATDPRTNPRDGAVERFARLVGVRPADIAVVPSTTTGENMLVEALGVGPGAGVVTDALHYDGSLALYAELARGGVPVAVVRPRGGSIDLADMRAVLTPGVRLVAVSLISSDTGFEYDLAELCALAHARGAMVYADIIQAAGAVPLDLTAAGVDFACAGGYLTAAGVDFACAGGYKWLMGDFGAAFLYVRPDRLDRLKRTQIGWRQLRGHAGHVLPFDAPGPAVGDYSLASDAAGLFEVGTPAWGALAVIAAGLDTIAGRGGPEALTHARRPLSDRLQESLPRLGFLPLTPAGARSPVTVFAFEGADKRFADRLKAAGIRISLYPNRIRVSPSAYNTLDDIDHLASVLAS
jgi:selenocysteine lyase/cysteine desulfurase